MDILQNLLPQILKIIHLNFNNIWFQHDGAPAHFEENIRLYQDQIFPTGGLDGLLNLNPWSFSFGVIRNA